MTNLKLWSQPTSLFDAFFSDANTNYEFRPSVDIKETEDAFTLSFDVPGLKKDEVDIELHENSLVVSGERKTETDDDQKNYHRVERTYGKFKRVFSLPNTIDSEKIDAKLEDGVLSLVVGKKAETKPKKIKLIQ